MKFKQYKKCIVTDEESRPMAFSDKQLCYCDDECWKGEIHPVKVISVEEARKQIKQSIAWRKKNNFSANKGDYKLMPVTAP